MDKREVKREGAIKKNSKRRAARRKKRILAFFFVFIFVLLCVGAVLSATILFPVKNIVVSGDSIYTKQQIITASAVDGDNIIMLSSKGVEERISKNLPYTSKIEVEKVFPDTLKITVNSAKVKYFTACEDGYYVLDDKFKVVQIDKEIPENAIYIKCNEVDKIEAGDTFTLPEADNEIFTRITALAKEKELNITGINVTDKLDLQIIVDGKILVNFGSDVDLDKKITHFAVMYKELPESSQGIANLKLWTAENTTATFRDVKLDLMNFCQLSTVTAE